MRASANEKESVMSLPSKCLACLLVAIPVGLAGTVSAAPIGAPLALHAAAGAPVETVQWRGHWGGWRGGWGWGGLAAGAIVGGALAAGAPWYGYDYDYAPGYYDYSYDPGYYGYSSGPSSYSYNYNYGPGYSYGYSPGGGDVAYCMRRFRSYDPASGTYLGFDGIRHPCP
jgi:hypothetical protein